MASIVNKFNEKFSKVKSYVKNKIEKFKNSREEGFSELPTPLKNRLLILYASIAGCLFLFTFSAIYMHSFDVFIGGVVFGGCFVFTSLYHYYIFTRKKYKRWIIIPLEKRKEERFFKKNKSYIVICCCPDQTQREIKVSKNDYSKLIIGATYIFYFGLNERDMNGIDYNVIYGYENFMPNNTESHTKNIEEIEE